MASLRRSSRNRAVSRLALKLATGEGKTTVMVRLKRDGHGVEPVALATSFKILID